MSTVSTTSILGSDSISGSRTTINSNFLLLQNWINAYATTFNIDSVNGILDLAEADYVELYGNVWTDGATIPRVVTISYFGGYKLI